MCSLKYRTLLCEMGSCEIPHQLIPMIKSYGLIIWRFLTRVEISSWLNSKLLFKMALQLHVKTSTRYTKVKFQPSLANPRWNFNTGWKRQISHIIDIFPNPARKFDTNQMDFSNGLMTNLSILQYVYKNLKVSWNSEIATQTLAKPNCTKKWEKV